MIPPWWSPDFDIGGRFRVREGEERTAAAGLTRVYQGMFTAIRFLDMTVSLPLQLGWMVGLSVCGL